MDQLIHNGTHTKINSDKTMLLQMSSLCVVHHMSSRGAFIQRTASTFIVLNLLHVCLIKYIYILTDLK